MQEDREERVVRQGHRKPSWAERVSVDTAYDGCSAEHYRSHLERVKGG